MIEITDIKDLNLMRNLIFNLPSAEDRFVFCLARINLKVSFNFKYYTLLSF